MVPHLSVLGLQKCKCNRGRLEKGLRKGQAAFWGNGKLAQYVLDPHMEITYSPTGCWVAVRVSPVLVERKSLDGGQRKRMETEGER